MITRGNCATLGIPTYFNVVSEAMDFTTMRVRAVPLRDVKKVLAVVLRGLSSIMTCCLCCFPCVSLHQHKAKAGSYHNADAFLLDLRLIVANAKAFNPPRDAVYKLAEAVSEQVDRLAPRVRFRFLFSL